MKALIAKIAESARRQLVLPPLSRPAEELARYRRFLKVECHRVKILHRGGGEGLLVCRLRSAVYDELLRHLWEAIEQTNPARGIPLRVALVAYGGYGRAEQCPHSDLDLMFLHDGSATPGSPAEKLLADRTSALLYPLWDLGLKVGHAVRTVSECIQVANSDMQAKTALLDTRLLCGDAALHEEMRERYDRECVRGSEDQYIAQRLADQTSRHTKHGNSPAMQEPNLKNGCGGLRDFQNVLWMAYFKHRARSLADLEKKEFIARAERRQLEAAYDFLLRTRNELHYTANRPVDALAANVKPPVATGLGYTDRSPIRRVEAFMRDLYTHTRNCYVITQTLEQRLALLPNPADGRRRAAVGGRKRTESPVFDGFRIADGQITIAAKNVFREEPNRLLRVFRHAQQRGLRLHPDLAQVVRQQMNLVDKSFLTDPRNHATFLEILNKAGNVAPSLRAMHDVGLLGKFVPEFGRLTNLVQHEFYHQYAVDEHTLNCIAQLDRVWDAPSRPHSSYTELLRDVEHPWVLYFALLLHDAGKADNSGRHEIVGGLLVEKAARRMKLDAANTRLIRQVVELHLAMVKASQRRDLEDPEVIAEFTKLVENETTLDLLTLHTFADSMGTSDTLWNGFKDSLLWQLYHKSHALLRGDTEMAKAAQKRLEILRESVRRLLPKDFDAEEIDAHFAGLPPRYFALHGAREIATDVGLIHQFMQLQIEEGDRALEPVIRWHLDTDRGYASVRICTWDRAGLFSKVAGALTAAGLNIFSAQIFTRTDGIVLDTFSVTAARTGTLPEASARQLFQRTILSVLVDGTDVGKAIAKASQNSPLWQAAGGERMPTKIRFDNRTLPKSTIIDVEAEDRVGLLHAFSVALAELGLDLILAKVVTEKGAAIDSFYVTEPRPGQPEPGKVEDPARQQQIIQRLKIAAGDV